MTANEQIHIADLIGPEHDRDRRRRGVESIPHLAAVGRRRQRIEDHDLTTTVAHVDVTRPVKSLPGVQSGCGVLHTHSPGPISWISVTASII
jgi:hypothetical protein